MIKHIITSVVILVLALFIFSYITSPSVKSKVSLEFGKIKANLKEGFENIELKGKVNNTIKEPIKVESKKEKPIPKKKEEPKEPSLLSKCKSDFNYYADISKKKYNVRVSIIEELIAVDRDAIDTFSEIWGISSDVGSSKQSEIYYNLYELPELDYPIVLFAIKFEGVRKGQVPTVIACDNEGKIMEKSRESLLTFGSVLAIEFG